MKRDTVKRGLIFIPFLSFLYHFGILFKFPFDSVSHFCLKWICKGDRKIKIFYLFHLLFWWFQVIYDRRLLRRRKQKKNLKCFLTDDKQYRVDNGFKMKPIQPTSMAGRVLLPVQHISFFFFHSISTTRRAERISLSCAVKKQQSFSSQVNQSNSNLKNVSNSTRCVNLNISLLSLFPFR